MLILVFFVFVFGSILWKIIKKIDIWLKGLAGNKKWLDQKK
jgi:hypothetical protein